MMKLLVFSLSEVIDHNLDALALKGRPTEGRLLRVLPHRVRQFPKGGHCDA
jgi:hypothetical protein